MKRASMTFFALAIAVYLAFFCGCGSDDDNGTGSTVKQPGNPADLSYLLTKTMILQHEGMIVDMIENLLSLGDQINNPPPKSGGVSGVNMQDPVYHSDSKYWYYEHTDTSYYGIEIACDSVQFLQSGVAVQVPELALLTEIKGGCNWILVDTATTKSAPGDTLYTINFTIDITGAAGQIAAYGDVTINLVSTNTGLPPGMSSDCEISVGFTATGVNLLMNISQDNCPTSGQITYIGHNIMTCPSPLPSFSNNWQILQTFTAGNVTLHFENDNFYWDDDGYCIWYLLYK
jgi:hypothetical protein